MKHWLRLLAASVVGVASLLHHPLAFAQRPEPLPEYTELETRTLETVLGQLNAKIAPNPSGKLITRIRIVVQEVFDERDPVPEFANMFHYTSRQEVIARELLFREGDRFDQAKIDESARNLRLVRQLSLVLLVPIVEPGQDEVGVLVVVRDVWSLRLNSDFQFEGGRLNYLLLNPSEENLLGTHTSIGGLFVLTRVNYSAGLIFSYPRISGSRVSASATASLIYNRETLAREGSSGGVSLGQPLYSLDTRYAWALGVSWRNEVYRGYQGSRVALVDFPETEEVEGIPWQYRIRSLSSGAEVVRSFGRDHKVDLSVGIETASLLYRTFEIDEFATQAIDEFKRRVLPRSSVRISPIFQLRTYFTRYEPRTEVNTLGLQEDYRVGPEALLRLYPASQRLGSTRDLLGLYSGVAYTSSLGGGLARAVAASRLELSANGKNDVAYETSSYVATPHLGLGRLHHGGFALFRPQNYSNRGAALGGNNRLRGYPSDAFVGDEAFASNLEFRSRSTDILSAQVGAAAFYDVGATRGGVSARQSGHSVGLGVRALFPQLDRYVLRFDWGFPLGDSRYPALPGTWFVQFEQAFTVPNLSSPSLVGGFF